MVPAPVISQNTAGHCTRSNIYTIYLISTVFISTLSTLTIPPPGHSAPVTCVAALDQLVATGSADKTVRLWSLGGEERRVLAGHKKRVGGTIS